jgi:glycosyltransferase involved in cell wall biosynthesis
MGAYNEAQYLEETVGAVLAQTMADFALLLFDNGSTDRTLDIMQRFESDPRVTIVRSPRNLTPGEAANFGIGLALDVWRDCRWFVLQGGDDVMHAGYLDAIIAAAATHPTPT